MTMAEKQQKVLNALRVKTRPYRAADIAVATKIRKKAVLEVLHMLQQEGRVDECWLAVRSEPFYVILNQESHQ